MTENEEKVRKKRVPSGFYYLLDENKNVVEFTGTYGELAEALDKQERRLAQEDVEVSGKKYWVSTVFLGVPYPNKNAYFETMVFQYKNNSEELDITDQYCARYCTYVEALEGHTNIVEQLKRGELEYHDQEENEEDQGD